MQQYREYKVLNKRVLWKEEILHKWHGSNSNPANRVFNDFTASMNKKNNKELYAYRTLKGFGNVSPETDNQVRLNFLSPRKNIDKYKSFPMTTKNLVFSSHNKYIKAIDMRSQGNCKRAISREMGILTNTIFLNDA